MSHQSLKNSSRHRHALTLLEVILALAVLGICLAAIGEIVRIGVIAATISKDETKAQMLCESKMNEIILGMVPAQPIGPISFDYEADWIYTVSIIPIEQQELVSCTVFVEQVEVSGMRTQSFELTRWIAEPVVEEEAEEASDDGSLLNSGLGSGSADSSATDLPGGTSGEGGGR